MDKAFFTLANEIKSRVAKNDDTTSTGGGSTKSGSMQGGVGGKTGSKGGV